MIKRNKGFKTLVAVILVFSIGLNIINASAITESINVIFNYVNMEVNGEKVPVDNILYEGTTYAPIRAVSEMLGCEVGWEASSQTATINQLDTNTPVKTVISQRIDPYDPLINLDDFNTSSNNIEVIKVTKNDVAVQVTYSIEDNKLLLKNDAINYGGNVFELNSTFNLTIYSSTGSKEEITFKTSGLPSISQQSNNQCILVPAMPEKGFNWPYYIVIPDDRYANQNNNQNSKNYLFVEPVNNGSDDTIDSFYNKFTSVYNSNINLAQNGLRFASELNSPYIMPLFPRPHGAYSFEGDRNYFYTHAYDRDIAILDTLRENKDIEQQLINSFEEGGFDINDFMGFDSQIDAMIDHGISYLNQNGFNLEDQIFMYGYSAQGTFVDRYTALNPDRVKAYASGGTTDDMIIPLSEYKGENLIFPIGTYDYESITGNEFDLEAYNKVARLIHMGKEDTNNVVGYSDCYGDVERNIIISLWGNDVLPRALALTDLYGEAGGNGMFILDVGEGHGYSLEMTDYITEFFMVNRDSTNAVYPIPSNPNQLEYTLFE